MTELLTVVLIVALLVWLYMSYALGDAKVKQVIATIALALLVLYVLGYCGWLPVSVPHRLHGA